MIFGRPDPQLDDGRRGPAHCVQGVVGLVDRYVTVVRGIRQENI